MRKSKWILIVWTVAVIIVFTACQPNPEEDAVIGKNDLRDKIEEQTTEQTQTIASEEPADWEDSFTQGGFTVNIHAKVEVPEVEKYPIYEMKSVGFTDEQLKAVSDYLFQGDPTYDTNVPSTKSEILKLIADYKIKLSDGEEKEETLRELKEEYAKAPEELELIPKEARFRANEEGLDVSVMDSVKNRILGGISGRHDIEGTPTLGYYIASIEGPQSEGDTLVAIEEKSNLKMTPEEAEKLAIQTVEQIGIKDMQISAKYLAKDFWDDQNMGYRFFFTRVCDGIPFTHVRGNTSMTDVEGQYNKNIEKELITINVNDSGVYTFDWTNPYEIGEAVSENVKLIGLEEAKELFVTYMKRNGTGWEELPLKSETVTIDRVTLGYAVLRDQDNPDRYLSVPVWDFFGRSEMEFYNRKEGDKSVYEGDFSVMTINAVTGAIVNRNWGY